MNLIQKAATVAVIGSAVLIPALSFANINGATGSAHRLTAAQQTQLASIYETGTYNQWVDFIKTNKKADAPILSKITSDNFVQYAKANVEIRDAQTIFKQIGIGGGHGKFQWVKKVHKAPKTGATSTTANPAIPQ